MAFEKSKDKILFAGLKRKDKAAFIKAYDSYQDSIYRFVYFKVGNKEEAEDLTSSVFLKTWDYVQSASITEYKTLKALFYKVARNLIIDHYRKKSRENDAIVITGENADLIPAAEDLHNQIAVAIDFTLIEKKIFELKDEFREVIILRYVNELSISEIAETLDKSKGNIRIIIFRALKALREMVEKEQ